MIDQNPNARDITVDTENLYQEEVFTDLGAATLRRLSPVKADGSPDSNRPVMYIGETTLATQVGPFPVQFPIEADNLEDAFKALPEGIKSAVEQLNERAREMARDEASRIVVPSGMPPGMGGGPGPGAQRGSKIILDK